MAVAILVLTTSAEGLAAGPVRVELPIYADTATVAQNIRDECGLPEPLANAVKQSAQKMGVQVITTVHDG